MEDDAAIVNPIRSFVLGDAPETILTPLGIRIWRDGVECRVDEPAGVAEETFDATEVASGVLRRSRDPATLRAWAEVVLALPAIGLDFEDGDPAADHLLEILWALAGGGEFTENDEQFVRQLAQDL